MHTPPVETKNIFLADDDMDDRSLFKDALNGIDIQTQLNISKDGEELMKNLEETVPPPPDIIFLDLNMPRKNGFECLKEIRENHKFEKIPVVILSTSDNAEAINTTYLLGANLFVRKPQSFGLLKRAIKMVLNKNLNEIISKENYLLQVE